MFPAALVAVLLAYRTDYIIDQVNALADADVADAAVVWNIGSPWRWQPLPNSWSG